MLWIYPKKEKREQYGALCERGTNKPKVLQLSQRDIQREFGRVRAKWWVVNNLLKRHESQRIKYFCCFFFLPFVFSLTQGLTAICF